MWQEEGQNCYVVAQVLERQRLLQRRSRLTPMPGVGEEGMGLHLDSDSRDELQLVDQGRADLEDGTELRPSLSFSILLYGSETTPGSKVWLLLMDMHDVLIPIARFQPSIHYLHLVSVQGCVEAGANPS